MSLVICLAGLQFSAKEECSLAAEKLGFDVFRIGDWVREQLNTTELTFNEINSFSSSILKSSPLTPIKAAVRCVDNYKITVIDSVKSKDQVSYIKNMGLDVKVVSLHCPRSVRIVRLGMRERRGDPCDDVEFLKRDSMELEGGLRWLMLNSDKRIFSRSQSKAAERFSKYLTDIS